MAVGIENYTNIDTSDPTNYPNGQLKNNSGVGDGTPFDKTVYNDIHQVLDKLLRLASVVASGDPESEGDGYQYISAMAAIFRQFGSLTLHPTSGGSYQIPSAKTNPLVVIPSGHAASSSVLLPDMNSNADEFNFSVVTVTNKSANSQSVAAFDSSYSVEGAAGGSKSVAAGATVVLVWQSTASNWICIHNAAIA